MNTKLLQQVAEAILDEPLKFDIQEWACRNDESPCGTTACIAGHAYAIKRQYKRLKPLLRVPDETLVNTANAALGIDDIQAARLFYRWNWPKGFQKIAYWFGATADELAENAFWRIQHFIATEGRE